MTVASRHLITWAPSLIMLSLIIWLSTINQPEFQIYYATLLDALPLPDAAFNYLQAHHKIGHSVCYGLLTVITCLCLRNRCLLAMLLVFSLGLLLEGVQVLLPTRSAQWMDIGYNLKGILAGAGLVFLFKIKGRVAKVADRKEP